ncbi:MAG TPA: sn-glycerol-3-phosphate ABC transporter ATP-binding protein UgpC [Thermoanaerobaculia bacterium]|jgi:multiple sugar transport system ATP-binding protein
MATVRFAGVEKRYGDVRVIEDLNLEVKDGEFMVLVGPSGCGKSTALRMIAGLEEVTGGTISIGDRVVNDLPPKLRDIAMVFQNYALYPHMTIRENLAFGLQMRKRPKTEIDAAVADAAETLEIAHLLDRRPRQLSGGQRQRVAVGRAIVRKPSVFLFDEPLSNLDAKLRAQTRAELKRLHSRLKTTTVYVTHDQVEAMTMGQRLAVMRDGRIQQVGTPLEIYGRPSNLFVAQFVGSPQMNLIPATVGVGGAALDAKGFALPVAPSRRAAMASRVGGRIIAGIRPEDLTRAAGASAAVSALVEVVEPLGDEVIVHARAGEMLLVSKLPPDHVPDVGDRLDLAIEPERLHLFDAETEQRIPAASG